MLFTLWPSSASAQAPVATPRVAAITTVYYHNSHADMLVSRLLQTDTLDGKGQPFAMRLASLYTDQVPANDISRALSAAHGFPILPTVREALTLGTGKLAVDGVLLIAEHGNYPESPTGQFQFPKRRLFEQIVQVFRESGRVVPVFVDKHLSDTWADSKWIYDAARELKIPLMAGSSVPGTWREPAADVDPERKLKEIFALSFHRLDSYCFHALECAQALAERRPGGETGIAAVQCYAGEAAWEAGRQGVYDPRLLEAALARLKDPRGGGRPLREIVPDPVLFSIQYADGLKSSIFTLDGRVAEWSAAWSYADGSAPVSTLFFTQEWRPFMHFAWQMRGIEQLMQTGVPVWPAERTLLTSGTLDACLLSKLGGGKRLATPELQIGYKSDWCWKQLPPPPPNRPITGQ